MRDVISRKVDRIRKGRPPGVLDLFSGCGGLTLGFVRAGCASLGGVEADAHAAATHGANFHKGSATYSHARDITHTNPLTLVRSLGHDDPELAVDILVGGPPCPTFARVGRAKLREVQQHPEAHVHDPRARLY